MLYRGMDRAELDAAYNNMAAVPNPREIRAGWDERRARAPRDPPGHLDLRDGPRPRERLDLFLADNPNGPTLAFIHGGYWQMADKEGFGFIAEGMLPNGVNLALV